MASVISTGLKNIYEGYFQTIIHDTFSRPIYIYRQAENIIISTSASNNSLWNNAPFNDQVQNVAVSGVFNARVLYNKQEPLGMFEPFGIRKLGGDQVNLRKEEGQVRIKLDSTGASYLFDAKKVTFDGEIFTIRTSQRPHGLFTPHFYDFWLQKEN